MSMRAVSESFYGCLCFETQSFGNSFVMWDSHSSIRDTSNEENMKLPETTRLKLKENQAIFNLVVSELMFAIYSWDAYFNDYYTIILLLLTISICRPVNH